MTGVDQPMREMIAEVTKKGGDALEEFGEILAAETLQADRFLRAGDVLPRPLSQELQVTEDITA